MSDVLEDTEYSTVLSEANPPVRTSLVGPRSLPLNAASSVNIEGRIDECVFGVEPVSSLR